ncbi:hypothetical protein H696_02023 [Fonticula alba]|uniref:Rab-GAP TBC domain-containing protein n=1 Tax=Fonticula alba TaxID=691883 RepID=A0A058ZAX6_FONAL|nr:hypothetical protein H696_02023 [Fonticula alba]KCV71073.1 hypothetical protein H696_02023 [Fonticula alba]|eukprot:XP_009494196.1 hypothetical protein H696_02023 [Fonticula alba]
MYQGRPSLSQLLDQHQRRLHARNIPASPKALFKKFSDMAAHAKENLDYMDIHYTINSLSERANHRRRDFLAGLHSSHSGAPMPAGPQQPGYIIPPGDLDDQWIVMDETPEMASVAGPGTASVPSSLTAHHQVPFHPDDYPFGFQEAVPDVQPSLLGDLIRQMEGHTQGRPSRLHAQPHRSLKREAIERAIAGGPVTSLEKNHLLRTIYYWGCDEDARRLAWPFLLGLDQWSDTVEARRDTWAARLDEYIRIRERVVQFLRLTPEEQRDADPVASESWCQILKDIERTDRNQTYFRDLSQAGRLGRILLAYILHRPDVGYTQGMNDWLSPLLVISTSSTAGPLAGAVQPEVTPSVPLEYRNLEGPGEGLGTNGDDANIPEDVLLDAETFWLFHAIMEKIKDNFSPDGRSITAQLACLVNILGQVDEPLMEHLTRVDVDWVLFCYRWVLVCLKRELPWADFLRVWESSWTNYDGPNFFLLIAVAYLGTFREEILSQDLDASGVLKAFNDRAVRLTVGTPSPREVQAAERLVPQAQLLRQLIAHRLPELHRTLDRDVLATIGEKTPADPVHPLHTLTATRPDEGAASRGTALVDPPGSEAAEEESQSSPAVDPVVPRPPSPMMGFCD